MLSEYKAVGSMPSARKDIIMPPENITNLLGIVTPEIWPSLIFTAILCVIFAFFGFRLLKVEIVLSGALTGYNFGVLQLGPLVGDVFPYADVVIGVILAIALALISVKLYKACIVLYSLLFGGAFGLMFSALFFQNLEDFMQIILMIVIPIISAILTAVIVYKLFKPIYIISTSVGGMMMAFGIVGMIITPDDMFIIGILAIIGMVVGILPMIRQFRKYADLKF